ncbi:MAG: DUF465 domain-containing protein [Pseudomonadota bacterium]
MSHIPHALYEDFPETVPHLARLKLQDAHFARLSARYHEVNRTLHRAETGLQTCSDEEARKLRASRSRLGEQIAAHLTPAQD